MLGREVRVTPHHLRTLPRRTFEALERRALSFRRREGELPRRRPNRRDHRGGRGSKRRVAPYEEIVRVFREPLPDLKRLEKFTGERQREKHRGKRADQVGSRDGSEQDDVQSERTTDFGIGRPFFSKMSGMTAPVQPAGV